MKFYKLNSKLHSTHNLNSIFFYFYLYFVLSVFDMYDIQTVWYRRKEPHLMFTFAHQNWKPWQSVNQPDSVGVQIQDKRARYKVYLEFIEMLCCLVMEAKIVFQTCFFVHTPLIQTHLLV